MMKQRQVPILITWDVDPDYHLPFEPKRRSFGSAIDLCRDLDIAATFFVTANTDYVSTDQVERLLNSGHEVGCHGLTHRKEEDYDRMPVSLQRSYIEDAKTKLEMLIGGPVRSFRSPRVKTSAQTLSLLGEYGYQADSSVCSQRIDLVSSNMINTGWLFAPRRPYHPHQDSAFKQGDLPIWEIPVSATVMPFISSLLRVVGTTIMKAFFRLQYAESRRTGRPIVYLAHPTEFISTPEDSSRWRFKRRHFSPSFIRTHGFLIRNWLYWMDGDVCLKSTKQLFSYMASFSDVRFLTVSQYVSRYLNARTA
jgi:hypothetical protein